MCVGQCCVGTPLRNCFGEASASFIGNKEVAQDKGSKLSLIWLNLKAGTMK